MHYTGKWQMQSGKPYQEQNETNRKKMEMKRNEKNQLLYSNTKIFGI